MIRASDMVALCSGQAIGQLLLRSGGGVAPHVSFEIASILISLAILPVCLTRSAAPTFAEAASLPLRRLFAASPPGVVGAGITGLLLGAFSVLAALSSRGSEKRRVGQGVVIPVHSSVAP